MWMSHVIHMTESCHIYEWVMPHIWMSHVTHMNESCHMYEWVMPHIWMSHVTYMNESCHIYEWVMSHMWMSHVTHMNESCHIHIPCLWYTYYILCVCDVHTTYCECVLESVCVPITSSLGGFAALSLSANWSTVPFGKRAIVPLWEKSRIQIRLVYKRGPHFWQTYQ